MDRQIDKRTDMAKHKGSLFLMDPTNKLRVCAPPGDYGGLAFPFQIVRFNMLEAGLTCSSAALSGERYKTVQSARASPTSQIVSAITANGVQSWPRFESIGRFVAFLSPSPVSCRAADRRTSLCELVLSTARDAPMCAVRAEYSARVSVCSIVRAISGVSPCAFGVRVRTVASRARVRAVSAFGAVSYQFFVIKISMCSTAVPRSSSYVPIE
ncbi:hypothetical protein EVAR_94455_1 [Eumeta japonica]|uniref:Uncharacterized protein n=1 Tax=Eumeta variegata TaxID=151549 RepID=A0A4C1ZMC2_EUMVA|nr:hypothetical protein EVAR_94455_1 [Eumeta japonica]